MERNWRRYTFTSVLYSYAHTCMYTPPHTHRHTLREWWENIPSIFHQNQTRALGVLLFQDIIETWVWVRDREVHARPSFSVPGFIHTPAGSPVIEILSFLSRFFWVRLLTPLHAWLWETCSCTEIYGLLALKNRVPKGVVLCNVSINCRVQALTNWNCRRLEEARCGRVTGKWWWGGPLEQGRKVGSSGGEA